MPTGIPGLDHLLEGGVVRGNSLLIEGPPGSGKSTFAMRIVYEGVVQYDEPALIISFEEFPRQIYNEALTHGVDLESLEKAGKLRVIWTPPARILEGFTGKSDLVEKVVEELGVRRLVIDSITHFRRVAVGENELREVMADILSYLKIRDINALLIKELERVDESLIAFEEYLVDASIRIYNNHDHGDDRRCLEIRKSRGQGHVSGKHPFRLDSDGLSVFPHLRPADVGTNGRASQKGERGRVSVGAAGLDAMLRGGFLEGTLNLVTGYPGTGKTVLALHFLDDGLKRGERCLLASVNQDTEQILQQAASLGMDWSEHHASGLLDILHFHPVGLCVDELMNVLLVRVKETSPKRVAFDSIDTLGSAVKDEDSIRDYMSVLATMLRSATTTSMILHDSKRMSSDGEYQDYAYLSSCVVQLSVAESDGRLRRFVSVFKHAGSDHAKEIREFFIDSSGFRAAEKSSGLTGILSGQTQATNSEEIMNEVLPSLSEITRTVHTIASDVKLSAELQQRVREAKQKLGLLDVLLHEHFGVTQIHRDVREMLEELEVDRA